MLQDENEGKPEARWGELGAQNQQELGYVPEVLALFGKLHRFVEKYF